MPDLKSDFVGRVNRLPLRPTDRNSLAPLMEAISNSVFAITERFEGDTGKKGRVDITVCRDLEREGEPIVGFDIADNGVGFTTSNYESFLTPDSRLKEAKGGKGVGRLAWLKVFNSVDIDSTYAEKGQTFRRQFRFMLREHDQVEEVSLQRADPNAALKTTVSFRDFDPRFANRVPSKVGTIALRILSHFVPLFLAGNAPKVIISDGDIVDIESLLTDNIVNDETDTVTIDIDDEIVELKLWSLKCTKKIRFEGGGHNFAFITGNNRSVIEYSIDEQLGLQSLDGEYIYLGSVSGDYLDRHVNAERTGFTLDTSEIDHIKRTIAARARVFLTPYIERALAEKVEISRSVIIENPQFLFVEQDIRAFAESLQPNVRKKEDIFIEMSRVRYRRNKTFASIESDIVSSHTFDNEIRAKIDDYQKFISSEKKGALAEYVTRRKAVIDLLDKLLEYKDPEKQNYQREDAIHQLICPMRLDSNTLSIEDHNLWLLDDRLAFFHFFASDKKVNSYTAVDSEDRPDLAFFFDSCVAWREAENTDTVVLVEFKKPMRDDYASGRDPVQQILHYVKLLRTEKGLPDVNGKAIQGINSGTAFHCYVVADITKTLDASIIGRFSHTPDGEGYFGYSSDPPAFIEIVPYGKILKDSKIRNAIFFETVGITEEA